MIMQDDVAETTEVQERRPRRRWPWRSRFRLAAVVLVVLGVAGWRYGWPPRSWQTTVCRLEEIDWLEAARLRPECISPDSQYGARNVLLAPGELGESGVPVFDLSQKSWIDRGILSLRRKMIPQLRFPDLAGKKFRAGVFWVDVPAEHLEEPAGALDPAAAYGVLCMCAASESWHEAAELIVDLNRNRDLTDDPVMTLSDVWSHEDENEYTERKWYVRVFDSIELARTVSGDESVEELPATVAAIPALQVTDQQDDGEEDQLDVAFFPTSYRRGQLIAGDDTHDVVIAPDRTWLGCYVGPAPGCWCVDEGWLGYSPLTAWKYERGCFWGHTLDAEGRELRTGRYQGPTGMLRIETAGGERLRIEHVEFLRRGKDPHMITTWGWAPIPRFSSFTIPFAEHPLPEGEYVVNSLGLTGARESSIWIEAWNGSEKNSAQQFSIRAGQTALFRLPKALKMEAVAAFDVQTAAERTDRVWSSEPDFAKDESADLNVPQPGCKISFEAVMVDPASGNWYSVYPGNDTSSDALRIVITDETGKVVLEDTMEYG
jgi:hypothetical protein